MPLFRKCRHWLSGLVVRRQGTLGPRLWARPAATHLAGTGTDLARTRRQLLAENAHLRQQLLVLQRSVKRPGMTPTDRALLVLLAGRARAWRQALLIVRPETLLRWHRAGFRSFWRWKSRPGSWPHAATAVCDRAPHRIATPTSSSSASSGCRRPRATPGAAPRTRSGTAPGWYHPYYAPPGCWAVREPHHTGGAPLCAYPLTLNGALST